MHTRNLILFLLAPSLSFLGLGAQSASSASGSATFQYLAGTGFLCGLGADACPDIARADNGDTIEISGTENCAI